MVIYQRKKQVNLRFGMNQYGHLLVSI